MYTEACAPAAGRNLACTQGRYASVCFSHLHRDWVRPSATHPELLRRTGRTRRVRDLVPSKICTLRMVAELVATIVAIVGEPPAPVS